jgi:hypothetical protein
MALILSKNSILIGKKAGKKVQPLRIWLKITPRPKTCQVFKTWQVYHPYQEVNIGQILNYRIRPGLLYLSMPENMPGFIAYVRKRTDFL